MAVEYEPTDDTAAIQMMLNEELRPRFKAMMEYVRDRLESEGVNPHFTSQMFAQQCLIVAAQMYALTRNTQEVFLQGSEIAWAMVMESDPEA